MSNFSTIVNTLNHWSTIQPENRAYTMLNSQGEEEYHISYGELKQKAITTASELLQQEIHARTVVLMYPPGIDFVVALLGCIYAGIIPAPLHTVRKNRSNKRIIEIIKHSNCAALLSNHQAIDEIRQLIEQEPGWNNHIPLLATNNLPNTHNPIVSFPSPPESAVAFLQFTSGSTSLPKGVVITHKNCMSNLRMMTAVSQASPSSVFVSWLPHYHDLGLVAHLLHSLFNGSHCVMLAPATFLFQPVQWLQAISKYNGYLSGAPNFGYQLCVDRISPQDMQGLDLSAWQLAINAAEPIKPETLVDFSHKFAKVGFKKTTFLPAYGMAEATVFISSGSREDMPVVKNFDWDTVTTDGIAKAANKSSRIKTLVGCGVSKLEGDIRIVDPTIEKELASNHIGEIWIAGDNVTAGYYNNESATLTTFSYLSNSDTRYLKTGDLGFIDETGELFITGRKKDLIIINGVNYYPQDIESVIEEVHPDIRPGCIAACGITINATEELVVFAELKKESLHHLQEDQDYIERLAEKLCTAIGESIDISLRRLLLLKPNHISKTSSGKICRHDCKVSYMNNKLDPLAEWPPVKATHPSIGEKIMPNIGNTLHVINTMGPLHLKIFSSIMHILTNKYAINMADFDVKKSIFFYGIDSIKIIDIHSELEKILERSIPTVAFFESNTFIGMIDDIVKSINQEEKLFDEKDVVLALRGDISQLTEKLSDEFIKSKQNIDSNHVRGNRFLTGASGFVGVYLLKELLEATNDQIVCLVRAQGQQAGLQRITKIAHKYNVRFPSGSEDRIKVVIGDVSKQNFGLPDDEFESLAESIDTVYHCAAVDNFYLPYSILKKTNVFGAAEILSFAMAKKVKPVYYVSSCAASLIKDDFDGFKITGLVNGYAQTKHVAERIVLNLIEKGFPAINYRLGYLYSLRVDSINENDSFKQLLAAVVKAYSHLDESVLVDEDAFENFLAALQKMGCVPDLHVAFDLTPVEYAAKSIVATSLLRDGSQKNNYTFYNPNPLQWQDIVSYFKKNYRRIEVLPLDTFTDQFQQHLRETQKKSIKLLKSVVSDQLERQLNTMFKDINTDHVSAFKPWCPPCDKQFTHHYVDLVVNG